jgi:hypothetical protein
MTVAETLTRNGYTVEIVYDEDCSSPRENENVGLFLGFPHRNYNIGDEKFDPSEYERTCPSCEGRGGTDSGPEKAGPFGAYRDYLECETCKGTGTLSPTSEAQLMEWLKEDHGATVVLKVGMIDHSGVSYYLGGGASVFDPGGWDSGTCGYILDTKENRERLGIEGFTVEQITEALAGEIKEYDAWASGDCYGIVVKNTNREVVESCWGFIGSEYVKEAIDDYVPTEPPPPTKYAVWLTDAELAVVESLLRSTAIHPEIATKVAEARPTKVETDSV